MPDRRGLFWAQDDQIGPAMQVAPIWSDRGALPLGVTRQTFALRPTQKALAQPNGLGGDLDQLIVLDVFEGRLQRELARRLELDVLVARFGPHVRELLFPRRIDVHVARPGVLADRSEE